MRVIQARLDNCVVAVGTRTPSTVLGRRKDVFLRVGWNAEAMEPNAYDKAVGVNDDDNANTEVHSDSFGVGWTIEVFQNMTSMKEHKVDIEVSTIIGTETKIAWVKLTPTASEELSWDRAKARSLAGGIAIYLVFDRLNIAYDIEELIERISHEAVAEHLNDAGKNSANLEVSVEEPKFVWTFLLCRAMTQSRAMTQKSVRKALGLIKTAKIRSVATASP